jgi:hypothetical protein
LSYEEYPAKHLKKEVVDNGRKIMINPDNFLVNPVPGHHGVKSDHVKRRRKVADYTCTIE